MTCPSDRYEGPICPTCEGTPGRLADHPCPHCYQGTAYFATLAPKPEHLRAAKELEIQLNANAGAST
jgi:hypothetical protein